MPLWCYQSYLKSDDVGKVKEKTKVEITLNKQPSFSIGLASKFLPLLDYHFLNHFSL